MEDDLAKNAVETLKSAIEGRRTDIVRSILATLEKQSTQDTVNGAEQDTLSVINDLCCETGTPLHLATKLDEADCVRALLSSGADAGLQNMNGQTAFDLVQSKQMIEVFNHELLQATAQSNVGRVCQLLAAGVDVNLVDSVESNNTPLHWAATYATWEMVQCLCSRGASVNCVNKNGCTPLHDAVRRGDLQVIEEFLTFSADPHVTITEGNEKGWNAYDLASGNAAVLNLLNNPPAIAPENHDEKTSSDQLERIPSSVSSLTETPKETLSNSLEDVNYPQLTSPIFEKCHGLNTVKDPPKPLITDEILGLLWPQPQMILQKEGKPFCPPQNLMVYIAPGPQPNFHDIKKCWQMRSGVFRNVGVDLTVDQLSLTSDYHLPHIVCHINKRLCNGPGSYRLTINHRQLKLLCDDISGLNNGLCTLIQLFRLYNTDTLQIPLLQIDDWPEFKVRGILVDISQGRIPNMETLKNTIDTLSLFKISQVQIYSRFKDQGSAEWQLSYSRSEIIELEEFCDVRSIELVPVIEVTPTTQVEDLTNLFPVFQAFISAFTQTQFVSAGPRLSSFILDTPDDENLNINDARRFLPISQDQTMMLCGYPLHDLDPVLLQQLPPDVVFMQYGVQADHKFKKFCNPLAETGCSFCICPGTSAWNSLAGCPEAAVSNVFNGVKSAVDQGAIGVIVCDWSGKGHLTHNPFSWPAYLIASGLSWNSDTHWDYLHMQMAELLNKHVFLDEKSVIGKAIIELGRAETYVLRCSRNQLGTDISGLPDEHGSTLFQFLIHPDEVNLENLTADILQKSVRHVKQCQVALSTSQARCSNHEDVLKELNLTADLMILAIRLGRSLLLTGRNPTCQAGYSVINLGVANLPATAKTDLANKLLELLPCFKLVWRRSYLTRGLTECVHNLQNLLKQLVPEEDKAIYESVKGL